MANKKPNIQNLRSIGDLPELERKALTRKGGKASGEVRRARKTLREMLEAELYDKAPGFDKTKAEIIIANVVNATAKKGDVYKLTELFKLMGELSTKVDVSADGIKVVVDNDEEKQKIEKLLNR